MAVDTAGERRAEVAYLAKMTALEGVRRSFQIHYSQRPDRWYGIDEHVLGTRGQPVFADCSSYWTWTIWQARIRVRGAAGHDIVNGGDWHWGNTATMIEHGTKHKLGTSFWHPGRTLVFYGKPDVVHVAGYVGRGLVVSHGSEQGPLLLPWNYRADFNSARSYAV